jgi:hypothetical protein
MLTTTPPRVTASLVNVARRTWGRSLDTYTYISQTFRQWPCVNEGHRINFKDTTILAKIAGCMDCTVKEANEIQLHPDNFN